MDNRPTSPNVTGTDGTLDHTHSDADLIPLSPSQTGLWLQQEALGYSPAFHIAVFLDVHGSLDHGALEAALGQIQASTGALDVRFFRNGSELKQVAGTPTPFPVTTLDLSCAHDPEATALDWMKEDSNRLFAFAGERLCHFAQIALASDRAFFYCKFHHLVLDGWGLTLFVKTLTEAYSAAVAKSPPKLDRFTEQAAVIRKQSAKQTRDNHRAAEDFWRNYLADLPPPPVSRLTSPKLSNALGDVAIAEVPLDPDVWRTIEDVARANGQSASALAIGVISGYLARLTGSFDLCVALPRLNRTRDALPTIAMLVNVCPLRLGLEPTDTLHSIGTKVKAALKATEPYAHSPRHGIARTLRQISPGSEAIFDVSINIETFRQPFRFGDSRAKFRGLRHGPDFGLSFALVDFDDLRQPTLELRYGTEKLDETAVKEHLQRLKSLFASLAAQPTQTLATWPLTTQQACERLEGFQSGPTGEISSTDHVVLAFEHWAEQQPDALAVTDDHGTLTYKELNTTSNKIARMLRKQGIGPECVVGLSATRTTASMVALFAILKAGAAYLPLDPKDPTDRLIDILGDADCFWVVADRPVTDALKSRRDLGLNLTVFDADNLVEQCAGFPSNNLRDDERGGAFALRRLAYVIYTSGSSGKPKGVMIEHGSLANRLRWMQNNFPIGPGDHLLQKTPTTFDVSVWELFWWATTGASIHLTPLGDERDPQRLCHAMNVRDISHVHFIPSMLSPFLDQLRTSPEQHFPKLRALFSSGEALGQNLATQFETLKTQVPNCELINLYGPTEATVDVTMYRVESSDENTVPIGHPTSNTRVYVVDQCLTPLPTGAIGELLIGGIQVGRGYCRRPTLTADKFIADPFSHTPGARLYRTGDMARWRSDGTLEFVGRLDDQLKIRGMRVEPCEVEAALLACDGVAQAAVTARGSTPADRYLVAYIVPSGLDETCQSSSVVTSSAELLLSFDSIRAQLKARIPPHMVPSGYVGVTRLPLTASGKIDRRSLPDVPASMARDTYVAPRSDRESLMCQIMRDVIAHDRLTLNRVGIDDHFFEIGGHSIFAAQFATRLEKTFSQHVPVRFVFESPTVRELSERLQSEGEAETGPPPVVPVDRSGLAPASLEQERMGLLNQLHGERPIYNEGLPLVLRGPIATAALVRAIQNLLDRYEVLRTRLVWKQGELCQVIDPQGSLNSRFEDWSYRAQPLDDLEAEAASRAASLMATPYDLAADHPCRSLVIKLTDTLHVWVLATHHAVGDHWSLSHVMPADLAAFYRAEQRGERASLPALPLRYADYAAWQRSPAMAAQRLDRLDYWRVQLADLPEPLTFMCDRPRPPHREHRGGWLKVASLTPSQWRTLEEFAVTHDVTPFMVLAAALSCLLHRITGTDDIVIGTPHTTKPHADLWPEFGYFGNTLPLRSKFQPTSSFTAALHRFRTTLFEAFRNQDVSFEEIVAAVGSRPSNTTPLYQLHIVMHAFSDIAHAGPDGVELGLLDAFPAVAKYDLTVDVNPRSAGATISFNYASDIFDPATVARLGRLYLQLLWSAVEVPDRLVQDLNLLDETEQNLVRERFNDTAFTFATDKTPVEHFCTQAILDHDRLAVLDGRRRLTYWDLDRRSNQLAWHLISIGVGPEVVVGVCLDRSAELITALLAIWKAGGVYLPLDPDYPAARLRYMIEDLGASVLITAGDAAKSPPPSEQFGCQHVLDLNDPQLKTALNATPASAITDRERIAKLLPAHLSYVVYTSGSTGRPKGTGLSFAALKNFIQGLHARSPERCGIGKYALASISFDASLTEILTALCYGGHVVIVPNRQRLTIGELDTASTDDAAPSLHATPTLVRQLATSTTELDQQTIIPSLSFSGEPLSADEATRKFLSRSTCELIYNDYGPSETHVITTRRVAPSELNEPGIISIGSPFPNTQIYIVDTRLALQPVGVAGELLIGGAQVGRGYFGRPDLTAQKFIADPFSISPGARLYRTGDLAHWRPDGSIAFLGRIDNQVKIRGVRIDPEEIEAALSDCPGVSEAAVVASTGLDGEAGLLAYLVPETLGSNTERADRTDGSVALLDTPDTLDLALIRARLSETLPAAMLPSGYVCIDRIPLTASDKIDRNALPVAEPAHLLSNHQPPRSSEEMLICQIFSELLKTPRVGINDDFFALGGHSLTAIRLVHRIERTFGAEISLRHVIRSGTPRALLSEIRSADAASSGPITIMDRQNPWPLSPLQEGLWYLNHLEDARSSYLVPIIFKLRGKLDISALNSAVHALYERHEGLRTQFLDTPDQPLQIVREPPDASSLVDVLALPHASEGDLQAHLKRVSTQSINLVSSAPFRVYLVTGFEPYSWLCLVGHHIILDHQSVLQLTEDLSAFYAAALDGEAPSLPPLAMQPLDIAQGQRRALTVDRVAALRSYWASALSGHSEVLPTPDGRVRPLARTQSGFKQPLVIGRQTTAQLKNLAGDFGATLFMVLETAFAAWLCRIGSTDDVVVGVPVSCRMASAQDNTVSCYLNELPLRHRLTQTASFADFLAQTKETFLNAWEHKDLPFHDIVSTLSPPRSPSHHPLFQAMFNLMGPARPALSLPGIESEVVHLDAGTAKFDLLWAAIDRGEDISGLLEFSSDLFTPETGASLTSSLHAFINYLADEPQAEILRHPLLPFNQQQQLQSRLPQPTANSDTDLPVVRQFEREAARIPETTALLSRSHYTTYGTLNARANRLARLLDTLGVGPEARVAVSLPRSIELIVALLAIWKAGAAYVPIDPHQPEARVRAILRRTHCKLVIGERDDNNNLETDIQCPIMSFAALEVEALKHRSTNLCDGAPNRNLAPNTLAYIVTTSGSTGEPKAIAVEHGHLSSCLSWISGTLGDGEDIRTLVRTTIGFDAICREIWWPLVCGGSCAILNEQTGDVVADVLNTIARYRVNTVSLVPSLLSALLTHPKASNLARVTRIYSSGEVLGQHSRQALFNNAQKYRVFNGYGPSETTLNASGTFITEDSNANERQTGHAMAGNAVLVLDASMHLCPVGVAGEIYIGGQQVSRGYEGSPAQTAAMFVANPFATVPGARLYRTGDRGRRCSDGTIEFLGRKDFQVKLRGVRIELGDIETQLRNHTDVADGVVATRELSPGDLTLVAYVVAADEGNAIDPNKLREDLRKILPNYMVPSHVIVLDTLPRTATGKVDRRALPTPGTQQGTDHGTQVRTDGAQTDTEQRLCAIAAALLNLPKVSPTANFFDLGGHSLLILRFVTLAEAEQGITIPVRDVVQAPTLRALAQQLDRETPAAYHPLIKLSPPHAAPNAATERPLLICVHPAGGSATVYRKLAQRLSPAFETYAMQARGLAPGEDRFDTFDEAVSCYQRAITDLIGDRPYVLLGWSFGGKLAAAITHQLAVSKIPLPQKLYLLDTTPSPNLNAPTSSFDEFVASVVKAHQLSNAGGPAEHSLAKLTAVFGGSGRGLESSEASAAEQVSHVLRMMFEDQKLAREFKPTRIDAAITVLHAKDNDLAASDPSLGWAHHCSSIATGTLPGRHHELMNDPSLNEVVSVMLADVSRF